MRRSNIGLIRVPEREKKENSDETIHKDIMAENFPKLM